MYKHTLILHAAKIVKSYLEQIWKGLFIARKNWEKKYY